MDFAVPVVLAALFVFPTAVAGSLFLLAVGIGRASRKGYQGGVIAAVVLSAAMMGGAALFAMIDVIGAASMFALPASMFLSATIALVTLPRRKPRRSFTVHRVTFPYLTIGKTLSVLAGCTVLVIASAMLWNDEPLRRVLFFGFVGLALSSVFWTILAIFWQPDRAVRSFADVLSADPRAPILFLRAFDREGEAFVSGPIQRYQQYARTPRVSRKQTSVQIPLDAYLSQAIEHRIGPLVALGNPQDYFTPAGAVRAYFRDETWMDEFRGLAQKAGGFLVEAGASSNLRWELQYLRQSNLHQRLVVIAGHPSRPHDSAVAKLYKRMVGIPEVPWSSFITTLRELGYEVPAREPERGCVLGFDSEARAHVLASDADLPDEFVEPIVEWLDGRGVTHRGIEVACHICGQQVLKNHASVDRPFICQGCKPQPSWKDGVLAVLKEVLIYVFGLTLLFLAIGALAFVGTHLRSLIWIALVVLGFLVVAFMVAAMLQRIRQRIGRRQTATSAGPPRPSGGATAD